MPFGWKCSPFVRDLAMQLVVQGLVPNHMILFFYLDDILRLGRCPRELAQVTCQVGRSLWFSSSPFWNPQPIFSSLANSSIPVTARYGLTPPRSLKSLHNGFTWLRRLTLLEGT